MEKPKIRFKGYQEDWEQRKFGEIVERYEDPVETPTEGYTRLGIRSHAKGTFHSYVEKGKELETAKMFRVAEDKFIVNITFGWEHAVAITDENDAGKLVSHRFPQYSFNAGMEPKFFRYLILDENFKHHLELSSPGGAGRNRVLKLSDMLQYKMNFPSEAEQKKIAAYFDDLDNLITLHQRKCEEMKTLKKYMLQKMFPQNGQLVPQIRFSGFTEDWEQRKFSELCDMVTVGIANSATHAYSDSGIVMFRNQNIKPNFLDDNDIIHIKPEFESRYKNKRLKKNDLLVARTGYPGTACVVPEKYENSQTFTTLIARPKNSVNPYFLCQYLNSDIGVKYFESTQIGGGQKNSGAGILNEMPVMLPSGIEEESKIAEYFTNFDHLITLHQQKCDELRNIKKFMLQNMFI